MKLYNILKEKNKNIEINKSNINLENIKSDYFLQKIYGNINKKKSLIIVKYNKKIQNRLNLNIKDYIECFEIFSSIELEIILKRNGYNKFININEHEIFYFHIYFNDNKEETKNKYEINERDNIKKIKIIIDYQVKSFKNLFRYCECIESINFRKFYRNNVNNMSNMFYGCSSLKELNLSNFNTNNVTDMSSMFSGCSSLKELNLSNFNTNNVINMYCMFYKCSSLKELNLSNFNTNNVTNMRSMFYKCSSLKELNLSNFNINNVIDMSYIFYGCSNDLKKKIISENKDFKGQAF